MNQLAIRRSFTLAIALILLMPAHAALAAPELRTELSPRVVPIGRDAELTIVVQGVTQSPVPTLPHVRGLEIRSLGQTMSMQLRDGAMESEVRHRFRLRASRPGRYSIPAISLRVEGHDLRTRAEILEVVAAGPGVQQPTEAPPLELELHGLPDRPLWVGEILPAQVRLYVRRGVQISAATPTRALLGNFTLLHPRERQPEQRAVRRHGQSYTELVFPIAIAPAEAGRQTFQVGMDVTASIAQRRQGRSGFNDPFFDSFFSRRQAEKVPTQSAAIDLLVQNLPSAGRPDDFTGGIGRFTLQASLQPIAIDPGDPVSLEVRVAGRGNFDRLTLAGISETADWKVYPERADFAAADELGIAGVKTFEQALIPLGEGSQQLPAITLSFFDPESGTWKRLSALPPAVRIRSASGSAPPPGAPRSARRAELFELAPNRPSMGQLTSTLLPLSGTRLLVALQLIPVTLLLVILLVAQRRRRRLADPALQRMLRASSRLDETRRATAEAGNLRQLLRTAREGIEEYLAIHAGRTERHPAIETTLRDLRDEALRDELRSLFDTSDRAAFAADPDAAPDLADWRSRTRSILDRLPKALGLFLLLACWTTAPALAANAAGNRVGEFQRANQAFAEGRYGDAADGLAVVAARGGVSANLLFDLGNAALRAGRPGEAILAYERARLLAPRDAAIQANLRQARQVAEIPAVEETAWTRLAAQLSPDGWALAATATLFLACLLLIPAALGSEAHNLRLVLATAAIALLLLWSLFATRLDRASLAIVTGSDPTLLGAPFASALPEASLKAGESVRLLGEHDGFLLVRTADGRSGWTSPGTAQPISPLRRPPPAPTPSTD